MKPRSRTRCWMKWTGAVTCLLIVTVSVANLRWAYFWVGDGWLKQAYILGGAIHLSADPFPQFGDAPNSPAHWQVHSGNWEYFGYAWKEYGLRPRARTYASNGVSIPLWIPLVVVAIPTAYLWRIDKRRPSDHCQRCGYNLTGNLSGRCPECGDVALNPPTSLKNASPRTRT